MKLRATVDFHDGVEPRHSLAARLAFANGYPSLHDFLAINGLGIRALESGQPKAVAMLADWAGIDAQRLKGNDIKSVSVADVWQLGEASMSRDMRPGMTHRYCPKCVIEDMECGSGRVGARPYVRVSWLTRAVQCCSSHAVEIVEANDAKGEGDFPRYVEANLLKIQQEAAGIKDVASTCVAEYVERRIRGKSSNEYLDALEAYVAVDLCRNLGRFEIEHAPDDQKLESSWQVETSLGFSRATGGPASIENAIAQAVYRERPLALEMHAFFGKLRRWLRRNKHKPEFAPVVELFQGIAERNLPVGPGDLFVLPTRQRLLHSVRSASIEYGMMEDRLYQLMLDASLIEPTARTSGRIYFDAQKGHEVIMAALDTVTAAEMAADLDLAIDRVRSILDAGLIPRVEEFADDTRIYSRVRKSDYENFKSAIDKRASFLNEEGERVPLSQAARQAMCPIEKILELALEDKLSLFRVKPGFLSGLVVDPAEVARHIVVVRTGEAVDSSIKVYDPNAQYPTLLNRRQAERRLKTASGTVRELIRLGLVETVVAFSPVTQRSQDYVTVTSLDAFAKDHISLALLSDQANIFPGKMKARLDAMGIKSTFEPTGRNSRYYRIEDVRDFIG